METTKFSQMFYEEEANQLFPEGCKCRDGSCEMTTKEIKESLEGTKAGLASIQWAENGYVNCIQADTLADIGLALCNLVDQIENLVMKQ